MNIEDYKNFNREISRRTFLQRSSGGLGGIALGSLLGSNKLFGASNTAAQYKGLGMPGLPHFPAKAKRVIYLFMSGGPSHLDLFDYKPELKKRQGDDLPDSVRQGQRLTGMTANQKNFPMFGSLGNFAQHGKSGTWMSDLLPYTSQVVDDIAVLRSMHTEAINHDPGITLINTGSQIPGQPSAGAWASYGLGSTNQNMPAYVVLLSQGNGKNPGQPIFSRLWGSGFLPSSHQGVMLRSGDDPVLYLNNPPGITRENRRAQLDKIAAINEMKYATKVTQRSPPVFPSMRWPSACSRPLRKSPTSLMSHRVLLSSTVRMPESQGPSPITAYSPAVWQSVACASPSSSTAVGTSTIHWTKTCVPSARTPTRHQPLLLPTSSSAAC